MGVGEGREMVNADSPGETRASNPVSRQAMERSPTNPGVGLWVQAEENGCHSRPVMVVSVPHRSSGVT